MTKLCVEMWHISPVHGQPVPQIKPISMVAHPSEVWRDHTEALLGEDERTVGMLMLFPSIISQVCDGSVKDSSLPGPPGRPHSEYQPPLKLWAGVDQEETRKQVCPGEPSPCGFVSKGLGVGNAAGSNRKPQRSFDV